jgi:hypothetical protein
LKEKSLEREAKEKANLEAIKKLREAGVGKEEKVEEYLRLKEKGRNRESSPAKINIVRIKRTWEKAYLTELSGV